MLATNISFHTKGRGTLAPWDAPKCAQKACCSLTDLLKHCMDIHLRPEHALCSHWPNVGGKQEETLHL